MSRRTQDDYCAALGRYSMYCAGVVEQNYLRGVQQTDVSGTATFETIVPGCHDGRMPHMHVEIYPSLAAALSFDKRIRTSQLALPRAFCASVYEAHSAYTDSQDNLQNISFETDIVFNDGVSLRLAGISGDISAGYEAELIVGLARRAETVVGAGYNQAVTQPLPLTYQGAI